MDSNHKLGKHKPDCPMHPNWTDETLVRGLKACTCGADKPTPPAPTEKEALLKRDDPRYESVIAYMGVTICCDTADEFTEKLQRMIKRQEKELGFDDPAWDDQKPTADEVREAREVVEKYLSKFTPQCDDELRTILTTLDTVQGEVEMLEKAHSSQYVLAEKALRSVDALRAENAAHAERIAELEAELARVTIDRDLWKKSESECNEQFDKLHAENARLVDAIRGKCECCGYYGRPPNSAPCAACINCTTVVPCPKQDNWTPPVAEEARP